LRHEETEELKKIATTFRMGIDRCKDRLTFSPMKKFPGGCCKFASFLLARYLIRENGYCSITFISAWGRDRRNEPISHLWLVHRGTLIDITADQFDGIDESVIVTHDRTWHDTAFPDQTPHDDYEIEEGRLGENFVKMLDTDYGRILAVVAPRQDGTD
jgi:hypothetical protein